MLPPELAHRIAAGEVIERRYREPKTQTKSNRGRGGESLEGLTS
ncbi:MAG: hypothetical protein AVDCRST_MAG55-2814 [uncultured Rubrobacteraceae bacterium]|uniref:Uncharacterized protein n=1 Tax=uncultured Rubrobacteraceae bacterium TaxID=349277 RepID=A0A6J4Q3R7_9ACTN|nr:MAG: hypothetical protein AVDCRST_MAG55-2814 [uncultured Rubrobacteraceae bacterium]